MKDGDEALLLQTDPTDADSDDDGFSDGTEIDVGSDPKDSNSVPTVWVDFAFGGTELGTQAEPYNTLGEGMANIALRGTVKIKGDTAENLTSETPRITKAMRRSAVGGAVRIGVL